MVEPSDGRGRTIPILSISQQEETQAPQTVNRQTIIDTPGGLDQTVLSVLGASVDSDSQHAQHLSNPPSSSKAHFLRLPVPHLFSPSNNLHPQPKHRETEASPRQDEKKLVKATARRHGFFTPFSDFCFKEQEPEDLLIFLSNFGRLYEKILSRFQKSPTWTLRLASPSLSASSHRHIATAITRHRRQPPPKPKRLRSNSPKSNQPDGKVNTLLTLPPLNFLLAESTATAKKRSISHVKKNVTAVPVSSKRSTTTTSSTNAGMSSLVFFDSFLVQISSFLELSKALSHALSLIRSVLPRSQHQLIRQPLNSSLLTPSPELGWIPQPDAPQPASFSPLPTPAISFTHLHFHTALGPHPTQITSHVPCQSPSQFAFALIP